MSCSDLRRVEIWLNEAGRSLQRATSGARNGDERVRRSVQPSVVGGGDLLSDGNDFDDSERAPEAAIGGGRPVDDQKLRPFRSAAVGSGSGFGQPSANAPESRPRANENLAQR